MRASDSSVAKSGASRPASASRSRKARFFASIIRCSSAALPQPMAPRSKPSTIRSICSIAKPIEGAGVCRTSKPRQDIATGGANSGFTAARSAAVTSAPIVAMSAAMSRARAPV